MGLHDIAVNEIAAKNKGVDISVADILAYKEFLDYIDFTDDDQIPNLRAVKYIAGLVGGPALSMLIPPQVSFSYTLSPTELAAVNAIGRQPNFTAVMPSGEPFSEIKPIYTPYNTPGVYTNITINLNTDSENTFVTFS